MEKESVLVVGGPVIDIVYPYVDEAQWHELKYSLRSLEMNCDFPFRVWIVGDAPKWVSKEVNVIKLQQRFVDPACDVASKLRAVIDHPDIGDNFVWMNDDIYFINSVGLEDIQFLKANGYIRETTANPADIWRVNLLKTKKVLTDLNRSIYNYSTHLPFYYNKQMMKELIEKFNLEEDPHLIATLYHNYYFSHRDPFILDVRSDNLKVASYRQDFSMIRMRDFFRYKKFFNHSEEGFNEKVKTILKTVFPRKSKFEK